MYYFEFGLQSYSESLLTFGWSRPELSLVWSEGNRSCVSIPILCPRAFTLEMCAEPFVPVGRMCSFYIVVNGINYGRFQLNGGIQTISIDIDDQLLPSRNGVMIDLFHIYAESPVAYGGTDDRMINIALRSISVYVKDLTFVELDPKHMTSSKLNSYEVKRINDKFINETIEKNKINNDESPHALTRGIQFFMYGYGGNNHDRKSLLRRIWEWSGKNREDNVLITEFRLSESLLKRLCPRFSDFLMFEKSMHDVEVITTLSESDNTLYDPDFSNPWRGYIPPAFERKKFPAEMIFKYKNADLVVNDRQYLVFDRGTYEYLPGCNPVSLSKLSIVPEIQETDRPIVVLQDQFDCSNIAHFFFDSCLRAFQYCAFQPLLGSKALFILGGKPTEFHELALRALAEIFGLSENQFLFPRETVRMRSTEAIYWFSDQVAVGHPAQGCRPEAVEALQKIAERVLQGINSPPIVSERLYISRSDASMRRLHNEEEVVDFLLEIGFNKVIMSNYTWSEQIAIVASANTIVAPHGMALTHLAFNLRRPRIVELFNPMIGSEAYALLSKAYGNDYTRIIGQESDPQKRDFVIDIKTLKDIFG